MALVTRQRGRVSFNRIWPADIVPSLTPPDSPTLHTFSLCLSLNRSIPLYALIKDNELGLLPSLSLCRSMTICLVVCVRLPVLVLFLGCLTSKSLGFVDNLCFYISHEHMPKVKKIMCALWEKKIPETINKLKRQPQGMWSASWFFTSPYFHSLSHTHSHTRPAMITDHRPQTTTKGISLSLQPP